MQPIKFPEANFEWGVPKGAENVMQPLPCWVERNQKGQVMTTLSKWELTDEEIQYIVENRSVWLKQANYGNPLQPQLIIAGPVEFPKPFGFCEVYYESQSSAKGAWVWVSENIHIPELITIEGELCSFSDKYKPVFKPGKALDVDDLYFRTATIKEGQERLEYNIQQLEVMDESYKSPSFEKAEFVQKLKEMCFSQPILCRKKQAGKEEILF